MKISYLCLIGYLVIASIAYSQTGVYDFESASQTGTTPNKVTQTVSGVTLTVSSTSTANDHVTLADGSNGWGTSSNVSYCEWGSATQMVLTFSTSVNVSSLRAGEVNNNNYTWTFTPNTGSAQNIAVNGSTGTRVSFGTNFLGVTSITITKQGGGNINPVIDSVVINSSLPVELTSFVVEANNNSVNLNWETATEINNFGFSVQRKIESESWKEIGFVHGHGNSNSPKYYSFVDQSPLGGELQYRIKQIDFDGGFKYYGPVSAIVNIARFTLNQNFPNPFNPVTTINYTLPEKTNVKLVLFDILGREVAELVNEEQASGIYNVKFDGSNFNSGIYFYRITAGEFTAVKKLLLVK